MLWQRGPFGNGTVWDFGVEAKAIRPLTATDGTPAGARHSISADTDGPSCDDIDDMMLVGQQCRERDGGSPSPQNYPPGWRGVAGEGGDAADGECDVKGGHHVVIEVQPVGEMEETGPTTLSRTAPDGAFLAWDEASELSKKLHITYKDRPFHTVLSCAPKMYDEIWIAGKCMYKLEPVVADDGELIIYAPHVREISITHGEHIRKVGYHCTPYFVQQWDKFKHFPWGTLAHSTHLRGIGTYKNGVENCRVRVTLATSIPREECEAVNLGYRDPATIRIEDYIDREHEGVLHVPKAGEMLYHLKQRPAWAREM
jgi:hypothetical protein